MKEFEVNGVKYIGLGVPEGATDFSVMNDFLQSYPYKGGNIKLNKLPAGNYEIVGLVKDLYEKDLATWAKIALQNALRLNTLILKIKENE